MIANFFWKSLRYDYLSVYLLVCQPDNSSLKSNEHWWASMCIAWSPPKPMHSPICYHICGDLKFAGLFFSTINLVWCYDRNFSRTFFFCVRRIFYETFHRSFFFCIFANLYSKVHNGSVMSAHLCLSVCFYVLHINVYRIVETKATKIDRCTYHFVWISYNLLKADLQSIFFLEIKRWHALEINFNLLSRLFHYLLKIYFVNRFNRQKIENIHISEQFLWYNFPFVN